MATSVQFVLILNPLASLGWHEDSFFRSHLSTEW